MTPIETADCPACHYQFRFSPATIPGRCDASAWRIVTDYELACPKCAKQFGMRVSRRGPAWAVTNAVLIGFVVAFAVCAGCGVIR